MRKASVVGTHPRYDVPAASTVEAVHRAALLLSLAVIPFTSTVLSSGWWGDMAVLLSVIPGTPTMKANTSLSLLLCGVASAILASSPERGAKRLAGLLASLAAVICGLTAVEIAAGIDLGIDQLLVGDRHSLYAPPGQMSAATAVSGILAGAVPLLVGIVVTAIIDQPAVAMAVLAVANTGILFRHPAQCPALDFQQDRPRHPGRADLSQGPDRTDRCMTRPITVQTGARTEGAPRQSGPDRIP